MIESGKPNILLKLHFAGWATRGSSRVQLRKSVKIIVGAKSQRLQSLIMILVEVILSKQWNT